ncbi:MAG: phosphoenolpyruvate carboxykinase (ATP) [candidate division Zixibacteria bacterium]|nr:phosphoenolpyruvate carboxykinase (ATP) [candidate division Zixibacteria bacterium]
MATRTHPQTPETIHPSRPSAALEEIGLHNLGRVYADLVTPALYEQVIRRREGILSHMGPLVVRTGHHTGRSANDKFIVDDEVTHDKVWWGKVNRPFDAQRFDALYRRIGAYLQGQDVYVQDLFACADPAYRLRVRVITETAWHSLFARTLFLGPESADLAGFRPDYTLVHAPHFHALPEIDATNSETFIILNFARRLVIIGGTSYAGEIKKSVFTTLNFLLPQRGVLSMHCSANVGSGGDVALFFGLSGTGKTTLSADPERALVGDDEHGWSDDGVFNFEGGCYAKVIRLSASAEPDIFACTRRFGTILENVATDAINRQLDLDDDSLTENTRAAYPISHLANVVPNGCAGHPLHIVFLSADAFGVLPPISRLTPAQAMYYFISGYTAKLGGTEKGLGKEPQATFSTCFGAPFMALHPTVYANLLAERIRRHQVEVWLVNTGWGGGAYGVGRRIAIAHTRAMIKAALSGQLAKVPTGPHPVFQVAVPRSCPGVPTEILNPRATWTDPAGYDESARALAGRFRDNFVQFADSVSKEVAKAGPIA